MTAGLNILVNILRKVNDDDDAVGGASDTESIVYENSSIRMQADVEEQLFLEQGLETTRTFTGILSPGTLIIHERDELEVVAPYNHQYFGKRFRVITIRYSDFVPDDPRSYIVLKLTRSVRAHESQ